MTNTEFGILLFGVACVVTSAIVMWGWPIAMFLLGAFCAGWMLTKTVWNA